LKRKTHYFLISLLLIIFGIINIFPKYNISVNADVRASNFPVYISQSKTLGFQMLDNITQYLIITATTNAFNVTGNGLVIRDADGYFGFTPNINSTIKISHNMDYVEIRNYNNTWEDIQVKDNTFFDLYENKDVMLVFQIKPYDMSGFWTKIAIGIVSVCGLIFAPIFSVNYTKDKMEQMFIIAMCWLFFGILFYTWIYMW